MHGSSLTCNSLLQYGDILHGNISQGSVATPLTCNGLFNDILMHTTVRIYSNPEERVLL